MKNKKAWISILAGLLALIMVLGLFIGVLPSFASAASSSEIKNQINSLKGDKKEIDSKVKELQAQVSGNKEEMSAIVADKNAIDQQISLIHEKVANLNEQIASYSLLIADKQDELVAAESRLAELNAKNKERIRSMEENGSLSYWSVLFKASSFADLLDRLNMIDEIAASDRRRLKEMSAVAQTIAEAKADLEEEKAGLEDAKTELSESQAELDEQRAQADALLLELKAKGDEFQALLEAGEDEQAELAQQIAQMEKEYDAAKYREWLATSVATTQPSGGDLPPSPPSSAGWIRPCSYIKLTSPFGYRLHPVSGGWKMHYGVDLCGPTGTPIYASRAGVVTIAAPSSSAGNYVTINHGDGFSSVYMHMTNYIVSVGQYVNQGQVIGYMGSTGISTGSHLHFGIAYNGTYVNPCDYVSL